MKETQAAFKVMNQMKADGVIGKYAIGGAIAASFYLEPSATYDIDIFIPFDVCTSKIISPITPIYDYLKEKGYDKIEREHIVVEGWQIQFLPADDPLNKEAVDQATETEVGGETIWVMTAEHLMAIALKTGRPKDLIRLDQFVQQEFDAELFNQILSRYNLLQKWDQFNKKYYSGINK